MTGLRADEQTFPKPHPYPVLTLPNEITSEIFIHFLPTYPLCPPPTGLLSPTLLTHICSRWRQIALSTPALWRAFSWQFTNSGTFDEKMELLKKWFMRAGSSLLSIEAAEDRLPTGILLEALLPHRERLEYARLRTSHFDPNLLHEAMISLRRLHLLLEFDEYPAPPIKFHGVPLLRSVSFEYRTEGTVMLPWAQLTSLALDYVFPEECTPILQQAVNLVHCELAIASESRGTFSEEPNIQLLRLESLVLMGGIDRHCLDTFTVPALRSFHISGQFLTPDPIASLASLISKSGCKLQTLCIAGERTLPKHAYRNAFPTISKLSFNKRWTEWYREHDPRGDEEDSDLD
ncbi:hypothetical protein C8R43DRAFT_1114284 [Mycena crocata]|nr:hypothetical protein C8R43DRAFT_1114284 [Mycena crocata]